jgi:2-oxoglutarate ferredoxin oxidoreductase subunit delta
MAKVKGDIVIDLEICKGCELCISVCPEDTLGLGNKINVKGYRYIAKVNDNCTGCSNCAIICPDSVFTVYRMKLN